MELSYSQQVKTQQLRVFKYHALGNSYLIIDPKHITKYPELLDSTLDDSPTPVQELVKMLCSTSYGIGSNGLLFGPLITPGNDSFQLQIINSDATMAGLSGNGVRIFAKYLIDAGYAANRVGETISVEIVEHVLEAAEPKRNRVSIRIIDIGPQLEVTLGDYPQFGPEAVHANPKLIEPSGSWYRVQTISEVGNLFIPTENTWNKSAFVDIGNPHCVTFVDKPEHVPDTNALMNLRQELQSIAYRNQSITFKNGCNLQWIFVESRTRVRATIFERGEGPTQSSGSSACGVAAVAFKHGLIDSHVEIVMPGGALKVCIHGRPDHITRLALIGSATRVLDGWIDCVRSVCAT